MANLRILYENAVDTISSVSVSTQASASLAGTNLLTDLKSEAWRSVGTTASITLNWASAVSLAAVLLPCTNLTAGATMRVRTTGPAASYDSGVLPACPGTPKTPWGWTTGQTNVNSFGFGGGRGARHWMTSTAQVTQLVIDLVDSANPLGYLEVSRVLAGLYWEAEKNVDYGATLSLADESTLYRSGAGDRLADVSFRYRKQSLPLTKLSPADRAQLWKTAQMCGTARPIFVSLYPNDADGDLEQDHMMWAAFAQAPAISIPSFRVFAATLDLDEM